MSGGPGSMQRRIVEAMATRHGTVNKASTRWLQLHPVIGGDFVQVREKSKREGCRKVCTTCDGCRRR
jgi:hypothetical protein